MLKIGNLLIQCQVNLFHSPNLNIFLFNLGIFGSNQSLIFSFPLLVRFHRHCNLLCNLLQWSYLLIFVSKVAVFLLKFQQQLCTIFNRITCIWWILFIRLFILQWWTWCRTIYLLQYGFTRYSKNTPWSCFSYPKLYISGLKTYFVHKRVLFVRLGLLALKLYNCLMLLTVFHV